MTVVEMERMDWREKNLGDRKNARKAVIEAQRRCDKNLNFNCETEGKIKIIFKRLNYLQREKEMFLSFLI